MGQCCNEVCLYINLLEFFALSLPQCCPFVAAVRCSFSIPHSPTCIRLLEPGGRSVSEIIVSFGAYNQILQMNQCFNTPMAKHHHVCICLTGVDVCVGLGGRKYRGTPGHCLLEV